MTRPILLVITLLLTIPACSGGEDRNRTSVGTVGQETSDAQRQGAEIEAFLGHIQNLMLQVPPENLALLDLVHPTEDWHHYLVRWNRIKADGMREVSIACIERFGRIPDPWGRPIWPTESMQIIHRTPTSVHIECSATGRASRPLHLIKVDEDWRIAAQSLAYNPTGEAESAQTDWTIMLGTIETARDHMIDMAKRIGEGKMTWDELTGDSH